MKNKINNDASISNISEEKTRMKELKENYVLKNVSSIQRVNYENLGVEIEKFFKEPTQVLLDASSFYDLRKQCSQEVKPEKEKIYCCPWCGHFSLRVDKQRSLITGNSNYAIVCDACNLKIKEKDDTVIDAWCTFHNWLIKNGYLDKDIKFQW